MANDVVIGAAMRTNLLSLQNTQRNIDVTQLRLATGKKVNSALDNPQSFFQAQSLNNRASDLTRLLDGIGQSIRTIEEADKGITALTSLVEQASSVADEAMTEMRAAAGLATVTGTKDLRGYSNLVGESAGAITAGQTFNITVKETDGTATTSAVAIGIANNDNVYSVAAKINADANTKDLVRASVDNQGRLKLESLEEGAALRVTGGTLTAAGFEFLGLNGSVKTENAAAAFRQGGTVISGRTLSSNAALDASKVNGHYEASANLVTAGYLVTATVSTTMSMNIDGDVVSFGPALNQNSTIQDVVDAVNNSGSDKVSASFNTKTGKIELTVADSVGSASLSFSHSAVGRANFGFGTGASDNAAAAAANDVNSESFRFVGSSVNLDQYTKDFNKLRAQIDGIVKDANYRGVNLLGGDKMTTFFNEDRSSNLVTEGRDLTVEGLGIDKADFADAAGIDKAMGQVRNALDSVRAFGVSIANDLSIIQTRRDFTEQTISTLKAGASDLTDADQNEEGANLLALQTRQQLGVTSLSLASQSQQSVLRLF